MLLGVGDSVTAGLGARTPDHSYFNRLIRNPQDEYPEMKGLCLSAVLPNLETNNLAVSGSTSRAHLVKQRANVHLLPLHAEFLGHGSHCRQFWRSSYRRQDPFYWYFDNVEDPNDRGYDAIRRIFLNKISSVLSAES